MSKFLDVCLYLIILNLPAVVAQAQQTIVEGEVEPLAVPQPEFESRGTRAEDPFGSSTPDSFGTADPFGTAAEEPREAPMADPFANDLGSLRVPTQLGVVDSSGNATRARVADPVGDYPDPTKARLRLLVEDGANVTINGHETESQRYSNGSRLFMVPDLTPSVPTEVKIKVQRRDGSSQIDYIIVEGGKSYREAFYLPVMTAPVVSHGAVDEAEAAAARAEAAERQSKKNADGAKAAQQNAEAAATRSENAAKAVKAAKTKIETDLKNAKIALDKLEKRMEALAKQAARSNSETFSFNQDNKSLKARAEYDKKGKISELLFDHLTHPTLDFKGAGGALDNLSDVPVMMNFYFKVQTPAGVVEREFELLNQPVSFTQGEAKLGLTEPATPDEQFSSLLKEKIIANWTDLYQDKMRIKVEIKAVRPDGSKAPVAPDPPVPSAAAPVNNRITIQIYRQTVN